MMFRNNAEYIIPFVIQNKNISKYVKSYDILKLNGAMYIKALLKNKSYKKKVEKDDLFDHSYDTLYGTVVVFAIPKASMPLCSILYTCGENAYDKDMLREYFLYWN